MAITQKDAQMLWRRGFGPTIFGYHDGRLNSHPEVKAPPLEPPIIPIEFTVTWNSAGSNYMIYPPEKNPGTYLEYTVNQKENKVVITRFGARFFNRCNARTLVFSLTSPPDMKIRPVKMTGDPGCIFLSYSGNSSTAYANVGPGGSSAIDILASKNYGNILNVVTAGSFINYIPIFRLLDGKEIIIEYERL